MSIAAPFGRKSRLRPSDLPLLRGLRDAYRRLLRAAEGLHHDQEFIEDAAARMALHQVTLDIEAGFAQIGRELGRLEHQGMGHGRPASSPAVGPAPARHQVAGGSS